MIKINTYNQVEFNSGMEDWTFKKIYSNCHNNRLQEKNYDIISIYAEKYLIKFSTY